VHDLLMRTESGGVSQEGAALGELRLAHPIG